MAAFSPGFDEADYGYHIPRLPCQIERVDGDAMATGPQPRIEGLEAKGLGGGGVDDLEYSSPMPCARS